VTLVIVGGCTEPDVEEALGVFVDAGFQLARWLSEWEDSACWRSAAMARSS
jgi:hypothetical protein